MPRWTKRKRGESKLNDDCLRSRRGTQRLVLVVMSVGQTAMPVSHVPVPLARRFLRANPMKAWRPTRDSTRLHKDRARQWSNRSVAMSRLQSRRKPRPEQRMQRSLQVLAWRPLRQLSRKQSKRSAATS